MKVREFYKPYIDAVDSYFSKLLPLLTDLQVGTFFQSPHQKPGLLQSFIH